MENLAGTLSVSDPFLSFFRRCNAFSFGIVYVHDLLLGGDNEKEIDDLITSMGKAIAIRVEETYSKLLGMNIDPKDGELTLSDRITI